MFKSFFAVLFLTLFFSIPAHADQPITLVKVLCMPDEGISHFSFETQSFSELADYLVFGRGDNLTPSGDPHDLSPSKGLSREVARAIRVGKLKRYGILADNPFHDECNLIDYPHGGGPRPHGIKLNGLYQKSQARGQCGGNPRIIASLEIDGETVLKDVYLNPSCFDNDPATDASVFYVKSFSFDEAVPGSGGGLKIIKISDGHHEARISAAVGVTYTQQVLACLMNTESKSGSQTTTLRDCLQPGAAKGDALSQRGLGMQYIIYAHNEKDPKDENKDYEEGFFWLSLSSATVPLGSDGEWNLDKAAKMLTSEQIAALKKRVADWMKEHPVPAAKR